MFLETVVKIIRTGESTAGCLMREGSVLATSHLFLRVQLSLEDLTASAPKIVVMASSTVAPRVQGQGRSTQLKWPASWAESRGVAGIVEAGVPPSFDQLVARGAPQL